MVMQLKNCKSQKMKAHIKNTKIALIINTHRTHTQQAGRTLLKWLLQRVSVVANNIDGNNIDFATLNSVDFIITLGGDGTILKTVRALGRRQVPIIGVNMGKLGFMAEFSMDQLKDHFERLLTDKSLISKRTMLKCQLQGPLRTNQGLLQEAPPHKNGKTCNHSPKNNAITAVNEVAVIAGPPFRMIEVSLSIGGEHLALCTGDGIIVSTPTGSTAYNLSAGGPILAAGMQAAVITPLAAHSLSFRPIVIDMTVPIVLQVQDISSKNAQYYGENRNNYSEKHNNYEKTANKYGIENDDCGKITGDYDEKQLSFSQRGAIAVIDGQKSIVLTRQDKLIITKADRYFKLLRNPTQSQWKLLNTKLNWGVPPNYEQH